MYTKQALRELGLTGSELTPEWRRALDEQGYFLVEGVYSKAECREMAEEFDRLTAVEREQGGHEVHVEPGAPRISNVFNKTAVYDRCLECKPLLAAAQHLLGEFKLHGANLRDPLKGQGHQDLHADVPKYFPDDWWVANGILLFDDMTLENGPTRLVPGSHLLDNPDYGGDYETIPAEMRKGSVLVWDGALWHGGGANRTDERRYGIAMNYCAGFIRQQENQQLGVPPVLVREFPPRLQQLVGYSVYNGLIGHIDKHDPRELLGTADGNRMVWDAVPSR